MPRYVNESRELAELQRAVRLVNDWARGHPVDVPPLYTNRHGLTGSWDQVMMGHRRRLVEDASALDRQNAIEAQLTGRKEAKRMPAKFDKCVKDGGKIRTVKPSADTHQKVCVRPGGKTGPRGGRTVPGHVKQNKAKS